MVEQGIEPGNQVRSSDIFSTTHVLGNTLEWPQKSSKRFKGPPTFSRRKLTFITSLSTKLFEALNRHGKVNPSKCNKVITINYLPLLIRLHDQSFGKLNSIGWGNLTLVWEEFQGVVLLLCRTLPSVEEKTVHICTKSAPCRKKIGISINILELQMTSNV